MREDHVRMRDDVDKPVEALERLVYVLDVQVQQGCGSVAIQQQANALEVEEQQAGRVEPRGRRRLEQHGVEVRRAVEVIGVESDLNESHRDLPSPVADSLSALL